MKSILTSIAVGMLLATIALGQAGPAPARAREWDNLKMLSPGTQIRFADDASKPGESQIRGTLESVTDSEIVIQQRTGTRSFLRAQIVSVAVKTKGHRLRNTLIGLGLGAGVGISVGYLYVNAQKTGWATFGASIPAAIEGGVEVIGGTLIGAFWPTGWHQIYTR